MASAVTPKAPEPTGDEVMPPPGDPAMRAPRLPTLPAVVVSSSAPPASGARDVQGPPASRRATLPPASQLSTRFGELEAASFAMRETFTVLGRLAAAEIAVLFAGETGTGKELLAKTLHAQSARAGSLFVRFDCGAVAPSLVDSELFGNDSVAPAGTSGRRKGALERAHGGTLFLRNVDELPLELQPRLLRALEDRAVRRVGASEERPIDVRVLAATSRDLRHEVKAHRFREDLYFRLAGALVVVPALRARLDDLPVLVPALLTNLGRANVRVAPEVLDLLREQAWPGNVRQLENALACALAFADSGVLEASHLQLATSDAEQSDIERLPLGGQPLERLERAAIKQTLDLTGGMKVRSAALLGIAVSTLYQKLKKYGL